MFFRDILGVKKNYKCAVDVAFRVYVRARVCACLEKKRGKVSAFPGVIILSKCEGDAVSWCRELERYKKAGG